MFHGKKTSPALEPVTLTRPSISDAEFANVARVLANGNLASADTRFTETCQDRLRGALGAGKVLLTHSCTGALEMAMLLLRLGPGDEVIMPSFTFASTANAAVLRGATPVFVDIREDTLNLDERQVEAAITANTRAIVAVHYAGVGCAMDVLSGIAARHRLAIVEDAAQCIGASWNGRPLGSIGTLGALSFHVTKNIVAGKGGALVVNADRLAARAEVLWENGTDRADFARGEVDKYSWRDVGSNFRMSELQAAVLSAQLDRMDEIGSRRQAIWARYAERLAALEDRGLVRLPHPPPECAHNHHVFWIRLADRAARDRLLTELRNEAIHAATHFVPLHSAPAGREFGRSPAGGLPVTDRVADQLLRLPVHSEMGEGDADRVIEAVSRCLGDC